MKYFFLFVYDVKWYKMEKAFAVMISKSYNTVLPA